MKRLNFMNVVIAIMIVLSFFVIFVLPFLLQIV
jgi:hypothetical protein